MSSQFRDPPPFDLRNFHNEDTAKNPVVVFPPPQWYQQQQRTMPTIPHIVGVITIGLGTAYALFEAGWLLIRAFMESVR